MEHRKENADVKTKALLHDAHVLKLHVLEGHNALFVAESSLC